MTATMTIDRLQREREALVRSGDADAVVALDQELDIARRRAEVEAQIRAERDAETKRAAAEHIEANARASLAEAQAHHLVILLRALELADQIDECVAEMATVKARIRQAKRTLGDKMPDYSLDVPPVSKDWRVIARRVIARATNPTQETPDAPQTE